MSMQELKNLKEKIKVVQTQKKTREAQLEPLQEHTEKILIEMDGTKGQMETLKLEAKEMMRDDIIVQNVEFVAEKGEQVKMGKSL